MSTNGALSLEAGFGSTYYYYGILTTDPAIVAPYWVDNDARLNGLVSWEMYSTGDSQSTDEIINRVNHFIAMNPDHQGFVGSFMFVVTWNEMHPYPAGDDLENAHPYFNMV